MTTNDYYERAQYAAHGPETKKSLATLALATEMGRLADAQEVANLIALGNGDRLSRENAKLVLTEAFERMGYVDVKK